MRRSLDRTSFTDLVGCQLPVQLATMSGVASTRLAEAVVEAGACGMVPAGVPPTSGACGVGYLVPFAPTLDEIADQARRVRIIEFFYGDPRRDHVDAVHSGGALAGWQVGSADEAHAAVGAGCDYVVAQGIEAGGHVRGRQPLSQVLSGVRARVSVPVVAAGGVASARRVVEILRSGADAVRIGTRFVACPESEAHPDYVAHLLAASAADTVLTEWFGEGWEHAPHRVLRAALTAAQRTGWRRTKPPYRGMARDASDMAMYAGTGVGDLTAIRPAREVVQELVSLL